MRIDEFLSQLEERLGISPLAFSEEGVISFIFNDNFIANIEKTDDDQLLTVYAKIGDLPLENRESCMKMLLEANLFGQKMQGASVGIESNTEEIYLFRAFDTESVEFDRFYEALTRFLQAVVEWTAILKDKTYLPPPKPIQPNFNR